MDEKETARQKFTVLYTANFGGKPFSGEDEAAIWFQFVDRVPPFRYQELTHAVAMARGKARWRPALEDFKRTWEGISDGSTYAAESHYCPHCYHGNLAVMGYYDSGNKWVSCVDLIIGHEPTLKNKTGLHIRYFPCACPTGRRIANGQNGDEAASLVRWVSDLKRQWGFHDTFNDDGVEARRRWTWMLSSKERELISEALAVAPEGN